METNTKIMKRIEPVFQKQFLYQVKYFYNNILEVVFENDYLCIVSEGEINIEELNNIIDTLQFDGKISSINERLVKVTNSLEEKEKKIIDEYVEILKSNIMNCMLSNSAVEKKYKIDFEIDKFFNSIYMSFFKVYSYTVPILIRINELKKNKYFDGSFHHSVFASSLKKHPKNLSLFKESENKSSQKFLDDSDYVLTPAVCLHCYPNHENQILNKDQIVEYSVFGKCFRDEGGNNNATFRLLEFGMREYVAIGALSIINERYNKILSIFSYIFERLNIDITFATASDIFFDDTSTDKVLSQLVGAVKIEVRYISNSGNDISIASINKHGIHFTSTYNILDGSGLNAVSMCAGVGLERFRIAILESMKK